MKLRRRKKMNAEVVFFRGKDTDERDGSFCRQETMMREAERLYEAYENYRFAPMVVKKYYLSLYYNLLKKYGHELESRGLLDQRSLEYRHISLYQDAGGNFLQLHDSLRVLASGRSDDKKRCKFANTADGFMDFVKGCRR